MIPSRVFRLAQSPALFTRPVAGYTARAAHTPSIQATAPGRDPSLSQGSVSKPTNRHPGDPHDQAARSGQAQADKSPLDAASQHPDKKASRDGLSGNPENIGFAEQVGSASASAGRGKHPSEGQRGQEESTPPGFVDAVKSKLGLGTSSGEVKQNRGGGKGVTGTGTFPDTKVHQGRHLHTSAIARMADPTKGTAPGSSRQPKDRTYSEQNEHLHHRRESDPQASQGRGNAAENPSLPSHTIDTLHTSQPTHRSFSAQIDNKPRLPGSQQTRSRSFSTSACRSVEHTADSYFKDIDNNPPKSDKTHQVSGEDVVVRPNEESQAIKEHAYDTVDKKQPYDVPAADNGEKLRYGNVSRGEGGGTSSQAGERVSQPGEGPTGSTAGGHRPERE